MLRPQHPYLSHDNSYFRLLAEDDDVLMPEVELGSITVTGSLEQMSFAWMLANRPLFESEIL